MRPPKPGIYWVKWNQERNWFIAEFEQDFGWWKRIGDECGIEPDNIGVVGPEVLPPVEP